MVVTFGTVGGGEDRRVGGGVGVRQLVPRLAPRDNDQPAQHLENKVVWDFGNHGVH